MIDRKPLLTDEEIGRCANSYSRSASPNTSPRSHHERGQVYARSIYESDRAKLLDRIAALEGMVPKWARGLERNQLEKLGWLVAGGEMVWHRSPGDVEASWHCLMVPPIPLPEPKGGG